MNPFTKALLEAREELSKAVHNGQQGKYRRVAGKTVFIRSDDKKVVKGPEKLKGKRLVMKSDVTAGGMAADMGSPSSEVMLTDGMKRKRKKPETPADVVELHKSLDLTIEVLGAFQAPELVDGDDELLQKCDLPHSHVVTTKQGVWKRVAGRPIFICDEGVIHAGPSSFLGKSAASLRDELRAERVAKAK